MMRPITVALDGPAGAGKSSVGERLAYRLGYFYFDTGVLYRAVALAVGRLGLSTTDDRGLDDLVRRLDIVVRPASVDDGRQCDVLVDGEDITPELRSPMVERLVSPVAASPAVRAALVDVQRRQVQGRGTVMAGRDIGTVILPNADLKVYLDASPAERARRRALQMNAPEDEVPRILDGIQERDRIDSSRSTAPLTMASDAVHLMTDGMTIEHVVDRLTELLAERIDGFVLT
jgi:cytidylate kinase